MKVPPDFKMYNSTSEMPSSSLSMFLQKNQHSLVSFFLKKNINRELEREFGALMYFWAPRQNPGEYKVRWFSLGKHDWHHVAMTSIFLITSDENHCVQCDRGHITPAENRFPTLQSTSALISFINFLSKFINCTFPLQAGTRFQWQTSMNPFTTYHIRIIQIGHLPCVKQGTYWLNIEPACARQKETWVHYNISLYLQVV